MSHPHDSEMEGFRARNAKQNKTTKRHPAASCPNATLPLWLSTQFPGWSQILVPNETQVYPSAFGFLNKYRNGLIRQTKCRSWESFVFFARASRARSSPAPERAGQLCSFVFEDEKTSLEDTQIEDILGVAAMIGEAFSPNSRQVSARHKPENGFNV